MKRRALLKAGTLGLAGLALGGEQLAWLIGEAAAQGREDGEPWRFGIMADTQWKTSDDWRNPGTCAVEIIEALNRQFIAADVRFVIQVGDLVNKEDWTHIDTGQTERTLAYRAAAARPLYDAGIGFFPVRGNHESSQTAAGEIPALFPQTLGEGGNLFGVSRIVASDNDALRGLSYALDFENLRIVLIDQFTRKDGSGSTDDNAVDQVDWVDRVLADRPSDGHALVMAHKNLIGQNHVDCLFGATPQENPLARNRFIGSLQSNRVAFCFGGHDHMHFRSRVASPDRTAVAEQVICASNSHKFYTPKRGDSHPDHRARREAPIAQELYTIGYYIVTVDGPCLTVEFYSASHGQDYGAVKLTEGPRVGPFHLRERFGHSLNGRAFEIPNGGSYRVVEDGFRGTRARILSGTNRALRGEADYSGRALVKTVKTGWRETCGQAASHVLKLWGLNDNLALVDEDLGGRRPEDAGPTTTDPYVLSLSYDEALVRGRLCAAAASVCGPRRPPGAGSRPSPSMPGAPRASSSVPGDRAHASVPSGSTSSIARSGPS
jgi:hypothetical protein